MPRVSCVGEVALHVEDLDGSVRFYGELFAFKKIASDDRFCALRVNNQQVFLLFRKGATLRPVATPGGTIPPHDGAGRVHIAFTISDADWAEWQNRLHARGIAIESEVKWGGAARSLYFRDPDGHLIELATPDVWD